MSSVAETAIYLGYLLAGPGAWGLYIIALTKGTKRLTLIKDPPVPIPQPPPPVTILIPAKDEGERIRGCLSAALGQDYPDVTVVAIDDRSDDDTGRVMDDLAARDSRLSVVHIPHAPLPPGWTGKNHALHVGAQHAKGEWLLFVDSDVMLERDAVSATLATAAEKQLDLLSLIPTIEQHTLWEGLLIPLCSAAVGGAFAIGLANNPLLPNTAFANGQYMLMRRSAYEQVGGHAAVRDKYCEDMVLARMFKRGGLRPKITWGTKYIRVRMYDSLDKIIRGWSRIFFAAPVGRPWRSLAVMAFLFACCFSLYAASAWGVGRVATGHANGWWWVGGAVVHAALMFTQLGAIYRLMRNPARYALLFPFTSLFLLWILLKACWMCVTKKVEWRGTSYGPTMAADAALPRG